MIYSSLLFIYGFLPLALLIYYAFPIKYRKAVLLAESAVFCGMISLYYLGFMLVYAAVNYFSGIAVEKYRGRRIAYLPAVIGIAIDFLTVVLFRSAWLSPLREKLHIPEFFFPIGISFLTLSAIGYIVDVKKGVIAAERDFSMIALYFMFFPRIFMGPVMHCRKFASLINSRKYSFSGIGAGLTIFVKGFAKKVILADNLFMLCMAVDKTELSELSAITAWIGAIAYVVALYFTMSGIADMGVGASMCFGIKMPQSFNYPIFSPRISYFSIRWLVQVKRWFSTYIIKPLYDLSTDRFYRVIVTVFVYGMIGYWYRLNINGIVFGFLFAAAVLIEKRFRDPKTMDITGSVYTAFLIVLLFVVFRGDSLTYSIKYLFAMFGGNRVLMDSVSVYLLRCYILVILFGIYASTDLFRNLIMRSGSKKIRNAFIALSPLTTLVLLIVCTALISYSGISDNQMLIL